MEEEQKIHPDVEQLIYHDKSYSLIDIHISGIIPTMAERVVPVPTPQGEAMRFAGRNLVEQRHYPLPGQLVLTALADQNFCISSEIAFSPRKEKEQLSLEQLVHRLQKLNTMHFVSASAALPGERHMKIPYLKQVLGHQRMKYC